MQKMLASAHLQTPVRTVHVSKNGLDLKTIDWHCKLIWPERRGGGAVTHAAL
jgi:hypothetical protein